MRSRLAITKLKAVLIIDVLIVALAAGIYIYLQDQGVITVGPKPASFSLTDLLINPVEAETGEPIAISANVTNVGETEGNYTANLMINDVLEANQTVALAADQSSLVEFSVVKSQVGNYSVKIDDLEGFFNLKAAPPVTSSIVLSSLLALPYESWIGDVVNITAKATNPSGSADSLTVKLSINNEVVDSQKIELDAGASTTVHFAYNSTFEGVHNVKVNSLTTGFIVVPTGYHTLFVISHPKQGVDMKLNGVPHKTPYYELVPVGVPQTVEVPATDPTGKYTFEGWEDGSKNPTRSITITNRKTITCDFSGGTSCPSLYMWNGTDYVYVSDVSNHGWLGYINYMSDDPEWPIVYWRNNPWDYIPLDSSQLKATNNAFNFTLIQKWDEIFYLDQAYLMVVDHPADTNVYSTMVEQYLDPAYMGQIYTVSKNPLMPLSAFNEKGENMLPQISKLDGVFTSGIHGIQSETWDNINWNRLTVDLGNLTGLQNIKLVVNAVVDWGSPDDYTVWLDKFFAQPVPNGTQITPPPLLEVKAANGSWIPVPESRQFPLPPDAKSRTFVVDLTDLFPTNDYSIRISNFWNVTFDYIGIDITPQQNVTIHKIDPKAELYNKFVTPSLSTGNFTRYGNVTELLTSEDDKFVIGRQGDAISLQFDASTLPAVAEGMVRDYFFYDALWFKDEMGNWGFGFGFTVDPLPFIEMSGFPYSPEESYPYDAEHMAYLEEYNTREITEATPYTF
jgi:hypothetical protein